MIIGGNFVLVFLILIFILTSDSLNPAGIAEICPYFIEQLLAPPFFSDDYYMKNEKAVA